MISKPAFWSVRSVPKCQHGFRGISSAHPQTPRTPRFVRSFDGCRTRLRAILVTISKKAFKASRNSVSSPGRSRTGAYMRGNQVILRRSIRTRQTAHGEFDHVARTFAPASALGPVGLLRPAIEPFARLGACFVARQGECLAQKTVARHALAAGALLLEIALQALQWRFRGYTHKRTP